MMTYDDHNALEENVKNYSSLPVTFDIRWAAPIRSEVRQSHVVNRLNYDSRFQLMLFSYSQLMWDGDMDKTKEGTHKVNQMQVS